MKPDPGVIPDLAALIDAVVSGSAHHDSPLHGVGHWKCVAWTGVRLARDVEGADALVACLFGLIHDSQRLDDGADPQHGPRAAEFARRLAGRHFHLSRPRLALLVGACRDHTHAVRSGDPTIGVCFDADRLNLCRLGMQIDERFLSSSAARRPQTMRDAELLTGQRMQWPEIFAAAIDHP